MFIKYSFKKEHLKIQKICNKTPLDVANQHPATLLNTDFKFSFFDN